MTNQVFLDKILESFNSFIESGTSRSNRKLKPLHGAIATDIAAKLGQRYEIKSQGYGNGKEAKIKGRYVEKRVDITIRERTSDNPVAGIAVKFVMQNYSQNSINYFENMLGETANIRAARCPYFQIFIIIDNIPYYNKKNIIKRWESFTDHNINKYINLSSDNIDTFYHTPNKTLIYVVHILPDANEEHITTKEDYLGFYSNINTSIQISDNQYNDFANDGTVIVNDYETFINKVYHSILAR